MSDIELCYLSAGEALGRFKARQLSPVELMQAVIARAQKVEPKINAFPIKHYDRALEQAKDGRGQVHEDRRPPARRSKACRSPSRTRPTSRASASPSARSSTRISWPTETNPSIGRILQGRRHHACALGGAGVLLRALHPFAPVGRHAHALEPRLFLRRLVRRLGRQPGRRHDDARQRLGHRRLHPHPRLHVRRGRLQAAVRPQPGFAALQSRPVLPCRPDGTQRGRLRAAAEHHVRPASGGHRHRCARSCASPRRSATSRAGASRSASTPRNTTSSPTWRRTRWRRPISSAPPAPSSRRSISAGSARTWSLAASAHFGTIFGPLVARLRQEAPQDHDRLRARLRRLVEDLAQGGFPEGPDDRDRPVQVARRPLPEIPHPALPDPAAAGHQGRRVLCEAQAAHQRQAARRRSSTG